MFWSGLAAVLRIILYAWVISLWRVLKLLCRRRPKPPKGPEHRPTTQTDCVPIDHPAFVRPDPLLYSQGHLLARGLAVTYDNPDITLSKAGVPVSSSDLEPAKTYDVTARIWNNSLDAPVVHMPVHLSFLDFGVGTEPIAIGSAKVDVGVKGSPGQPAFVSIPWTTPATPGHYCLQVLLDPVDDTDRSNNLGQENTNVSTAQSPAVFKFTLRNNTRLTLTYHFEVDAYQIPPLPQCDDAKPRDDTIIRRHRREAHPVPAGFDVQIVPPAPTLDPGASTTITVSVEPPGGFIGRQAFNINAFHDQGFAGGVALTAVKEP